MKEIQLTQGKVALVDDEDFEKINKFKWSARKDGDTWYAIRSCVGKNGWGKYQESRLMHRDILNLEPKVGKVDHRNHNGLDNQKHNLRYCNAIQNGQNSKLYKTNKSGFKGVCFHKNNQKWMAYIKVNKKMTYLGQFQTAEEGAIAYDNAAKKHFGEFAHLNFQS